MERSLGAGKPVAEYMRGDREKIAWLQEPRWRQVGKRSKAYPCIMRLFESRALYAPV